MTSKQNLPPPAYQEYAANMLANATFRAASLSARGLLYQLRLECWANVGHVPSDATTLAKYLGLSFDEFSNGYAEIRRFFHADDDKLTCPELDDYRAYLADIKKKQSDGGKRGASKTNAGKARGTRDSLSKDSSVQVSPAQDSLADQAGGVSPHQEWVDDYEAAQNHSNDNLRDDIDFERKHR